MGSPPHSPSSTKVTFNEPENDHASSPPLSPKRSFSFADEDDDVEGSLGYYKRRHVRNEGETARRAPLDPLSTSKIGNNPRLHEDSSLPESSFHSLGPTRSSNKNHSTPTNSTVCSWPPGSKSGNANGTDGSGHNEHPPPLFYSSKYSPEARDSCGVSNGGSALVWPPASRCRPDISSLERRTSRWDDKMMQSIRLRSSSIPYVRRPGGHWKAGPSSDNLARTIHDFADDRNSVFDFPPSLGPAKRECSESDMTGRGSLSLSLASGSQPLRADESPKSIPPIGAERSRAASMTTRRSRSLPPAGLPLSDENDRPHFRLRSAWRDDNNLRLLEQPICGARGKLLSDSPINKDEFNRLLRHTVNNKHPSKVFSPLSPLRNPPPTFSLSANSAYHRYFPSFTNRPSLRYTRGPNRRIRNLCELYQPLVIELECTHCQECKRDTIGKRLLVSRYRQKRKDAISLLTGPVTFRAGLPIGTSRRDIDEDDRSLWEGLGTATPTSVGRFQANPSVRDFLNSSDDDDDDDYPEIPDEGLLSDEEDVVLGRGERLLKFD